MRPELEPMGVVASIESAKALWAVGDIAAWKSIDGVACVKALLVCFTPIENVFGSQAL